MKKKKQQENAAKKTSKEAKQPSTLIPPLNPPSLHESDNEDGIQSHEVLNDLLRFASRWSIIHR